MRPEGMTIIVPFLNEEDGIELFCQEFDNFVGTLTFNIEVLFVNDGSTDFSVEKISKWDFKNIQNVKIVNLSKNFGSHAAIRAGLSRASYDMCTWLGSDLQEPLELVPFAFNKICNEGYDAVYVEKKTIKISGFNRFFSKVYSKLMQKYAVKNYASGGTSTIVFNHKIKDLLNNNIESNSSIMLQIMDAGFKYYCVALDYKERIAGTSKWTLAKKIKLFIDSFVAFSFMPIRLVSIIGGIIFIVGLVIGLEAIINKIINPSVPIGYSTLVSILALGFGITNISLGIIAEYLWRAYDAARKRPVFIISDEIVVKGYEK